MVCSRLSGAHSVIAYAPRIPRDFRAYEQQKLRGLLRGPTGHRGADCIADASAFLREGSQPGNLNQVKAIQFLVQDRRSIGHLSIPSPKRLGPEMVQSPLNRRQ